MTSLIEEGDVVVDIGAHIGTFSALALTRTNIVHSYEPLKENYDLLCKNAPNATKYNFALSFDGTTDNKKIVTDGFNTGGGVMNEEAGQEIVCKKFEDELIQYDNIDFLKIDIEGSEIGLLNHPEWLGMVDVLAIETHNHTFGQFYNFLFNCGFKFLKSHDKGELGLIICKR